MKQQEEVGGASAAIVEEPRQALFHFKGGGCNFHLATVCFTCAVISDKRSGRKPKEGTEAEVAGEAPGKGRNQATRAQFTHLKFK